MACPAVTTGHQFLSSMLGHIDCQAANIGSLGFQSLAQPGAPGQTVLAALLTMFIAVFAVRMMLGHGTSTSDFVGSVINIGIVLTLAASWPAFRTVIYDVVLHGSAELTTAFNLGQELPAANGSLAGRLQSVDDAMLALTARGTGRATLAPVADGSATFGSMALDDQFALGWARVAYLAGTLGPLVAIRLAAGLLLAIAPLVGGLLLLGATRGLFVGWLRGLVLCAIGSVGLTLVYATEMAILEPWVASALDLRTSGYAAPAAPTELLAITLTFAVAAILLLGILARVTFNRASPTLNVLQTLVPNSWGQNSQLSARHPISSTSSIENMSTGASYLVSAEQQEPRQQERIPQFVEGRRDTARKINEEPVLPAQVPLGSSYRRTARRASISVQSRDNLR